MISSERPPEKTPMPVFVLHVNGAQLRRKRPAPAHGAVHARARQGGSVNLLGVSDVASMARFAPRLLFAASLLTAAPAIAFTFSDGTTTQCIARGRVVEEFYAPPEHEVSRLRRTGVTVTSGTDYLIIWNAAMLSELPAAMHDLLFFHECAHAQVPTKEEIRANCEGLKAMRAAGRAGFAIETQLATFYGERNRAYWEATLQCANATGAGGAKQR
jgi:hypothetical protein